MQRRRIFDLTHFTPTTLAAMAGDLERADRDRNQDEILHVVIVTLSALVGPDDADAMVQAEIVNGSGVIQ